MFSFSRNNLLSRNLPDIFTDEKLTPHNSPRLSHLPPILKKARMLETAKKVQSVGALFMKQGRLLANYSDTFEYTGDIIRYYPTYHSLTDEELRGFFTWRAKIRKGEFPDAPVPYIMLLIYELINNIGVKTPRDGFDLLLKIREAYRGASQYIDHALTSWLLDYVVYYNLDASLIALFSSISADRNLEVLENLPNEPQANVVEAIKNISPKWLARSKFYAQHSEIFDEVIYGVFVRIHKHYAKSSKYGMVGSIFGLPGTDWINIFNGAIFCNPIKRKEYHYRINSQHEVHYENGYWYVTRPRVTPRATGIVGDILKTIDARLREAMSFGHPLKQEVSKKWLLKAINEEIGTVLSKKFRPTPAPIDLSSLNQIREDAAITRDKLNVPEIEESAPEAPPPPAPKADPESPAGLESTEVRLLKAILNGEDLTWVRKEGHILSILVDGINDKLYDTFGDTVLDETPSIMPDYIPVLKELLQS